MNKKISLGAVIAIIFITAAVTLSITYVMTMNKFDSELSQTSAYQTVYKKLSEIDKKVREEYMGTIDEKTLVDGIAEGYLSGIGDKYAMYRDSDKKKLNDDEFEGNAVGIGIIGAASKDGKGVYVLEVMKGSPASTAGIQKGDVITRVADAKLEGLTLDEAIGHIAGRVDERRRIVVDRGGDSKVFEVTIRKYENITVFYDTIDKSTGYVKITEFLQNTDKQFSDAIEDLKSKGVTSVVFDVRNNLGGSVDAVCSVLDGLIPAGKIMSTTDKNGKTEVYRNSDSKQLDMSMTVLVNDRSASAAEIFACVLRDYKKAKLVGEKTYGKCTMQTSYTLPDRSEISVSTHTIIPPVTENYEGKGLIPDFPVSLNEEQRKEFSFLTFKDDPQIIKAVEVMGDPLLYKFD